MKGMILAAGKGARLRPLTDTVPKVLAPVLGVPLLSRLLACLHRRGVTPLAMNTHHLAGAVQAHLEREGGAIPGPALFHEPELLGTGGGVVNAAAFWGEDPLLVWNGDIVAEPDLKALPALLGESGALAVLSVQRRESASHLLLDESGRICGIDSPRRNDTRLVAAPRGELRKLAFNGISLLAPRLRERFPSAGAFDLILALLEAVEGGGTILGLDAGDGFYGTTGSPEQLQALEKGLTARPELLARWTP